MIKPWPTVHRFVVIQYRTSPVGKRAITKMNANGRMYISTRCDCCIVPLMKYVDASWLATYTARRTYPDQWDVTCFEMSGTNPSHERSPAGGCFAKVRSV